MLPDTGLKTFKNYLFPNNPFRSQNSQRKKKNLNINTNHVDLYRLPYDF